MDLLTFFSYFGFITAIAYTFVPSIFLYVLLKFNVLSEESISILGILSLYINAFIYFFNSIIEPKEIQAYDLCNLFGTYLGFIYLLLYIKYLFYNTEKNKFFLFIGIIILSSILVFLFELFIIKKRNNYIIEWIGVIFNILEYLPLGFNLFYLIKNKISQNFTLFGSIIGLFNAIIWLIRAIILNIQDKANKYHSIVANIFGILLCILQIIIYFLFKKEQISLPNKNNEEKEKIIINEKDNKNINDKEKKDSSEIEEFI
jgi:amino acid permease